MRCNHRTAKSVWDFSRQCPKAGENGLQARSREYRDKDNRSLSVLNEKRIVPPKVRKKIKKEKTGRSNLRLEMTRKQSQPISSLFFFLSPSFLTAIPSPGEGGRCFVASQTQSEGNEKITCSMLQSKQILDLMRWCLLLDNAAAAR